MPPIQDQNIPIASIDIIPDPYRKELTEIESLALSLDKRQIYPITVQPKNNGRYELIDGLRRLTAAKRLGWITIRAAFVHDLDEVGKREIELESNLQRVNLSWQERCDALADLHDLKVKKYGAALPGRFQAGWAIPNTAAIVGLGAATVNQDLLLAKGMKENPKIREAASRRDAIKELRAVNTGAVDSAGLEHLRNSAKETLILGNWLDFAKDIPDASIPFIITDISEQPFDQVIPQFRRIMTPVSEGYLFFSLDQMTALRDLLNKNGFNSSPMPFMVNYKGESRYVVFLWFSLGVPQPPTALKTTYDVKRSNFIHQMDKPYSIIFTLIGQSGENAHTIFDPFAYGGLTPIIAKCHKKNCIAYCNVPAIYEEAITRIVKEKIGEKFIKGENENE